MVIHPAPQYDTYKPNSRCAKRGPRLLAIVVGAIILFVIAAGLFAWMADTKWSPSRNSSSTPVTNESLSPITRSELVQHSTSDDCWLAIYDRVYDLTQYASKHPGGADWITAYCGTQATSNFQRFHPEQLMKTVPETLMGTYVGDQQVPSSSSTASSTTGAAADTSSSTTTTYTGGDSEDDSGEYDDNSNSSNTNNSNTNNAGTGAATPTVSTPSPVAAPTSGSTPSSCISTTAVASHNSQSDCHSIYYTQVYDMTNYIRQHPGGPQTIYSYCGTDATSAFQRIRNHNQNLLDSHVSQYLLGALC